MNGKLVYPLEQIIKVKEKRVENQEKVVLEKKQLLEKEQEKLKECEALRDKAKEHLSNKLAQLRHELDHGTTTDKVQQMKAYLNVAKDKLAVEEKKVKDQEAQVEMANKALEAAKEELRIKRQEVDKLQVHKKDWLREARKELEILEGREQDEVGAVTHATYQRRQKRR